MSFFRDFSHRRPPPVSDHFVVHQEWSLTRALTVVKILLKDHIQNKRAIYKRQKGKKTHTRATLTQTYLKKRNHNETNKDDRGEQREGRHAHSSKANSEPKKTVVQPTKATEGEQREGIHTHSSKKKKKQSRGDHSTANKGERGRHVRRTLRKTEMNECHQRPYRYGHWLPLVVGKNGACAETENVCKCKCKYHIIHSPQGFLGIIYNTGWGTLPDC